MAAEFPKKDESKGNGEEKKEPAAPATENTGNTEAQNQQAPQDQNQSAEQAAPPPWAVAMTQTMSVVAQALQAIAQKVGASLTPMAPSGPAVMPPTSVGAVVNEAVAASTAPSMDAKTYGDLMGRLAVVERDLKEREKEKATTLSVATFEAQVKGWPFDDSDRALLRTTIEAGGDVAAKAFVAQVQKRPKEMKNSAADFRASTSATPDSQAVMKYVAAGPVRLEQARKFSVIHAELVARGINPSPEDKFIENQFATAEANARAHANKGDK